MTAAKSVTVCYGAVNAMLLNEFLEERRKHLEQQATISRLEKRIQAVAAGLPGSQRSRATEQERKRP